MLALIAGLLVFAPDTGAAVSAGVAANQLQVTGDATGDTIRLRLIAGEATRVEVLDGATTIGTFDRATFATILVIGLGGQDTIVIDDVNGVFTETKITTIDGGDGDDTIAGGTETPYSWETIRGGPGDDTTVWNAGPFRGDGWDYSLSDDGTDTLVFNGSRRKRHGSGHDGVDRDGRAAVGRRQRHHGHRPGRQRQPHDRHHHNHRVAAHL